MSGLGRRSDDRRPQTVGQRRRCADTALPNCQGPSRDQVYSDASSLRLVWVLYPCVHVCDTEVIAQGSFFLCALQSAERSLEEAWGEVYVSGTE